MNVAPTLELLETSPTVSVSSVEYQRLLGYPRGHVMSDRATELAAWARTWYAENGRPWMYFREVELDLAHDGLRLSGQPFASQQLRSHIENTGASRAILAIFSAGAACEEFAQALWTDGKPDEYFFLEMYGSAVVEHLVAKANGVLCDLGEREGFMAVPHYSPGYVGWDVADQVALFASLKAAATTSFPEPVTVLPSGMLRPKKTLLGVFGLTPRTGVAFDTARRVPCENCSFSPCRYRRAEYTEPMRRAESLVRRRRAAANQVRASLSQNATYSVNPRALRKWASERVQIEKSSDGGTRARFRFDGTTCSNMGHPLTFEYDVSLTSDAEGYVITAVECRPAAGDVGHQRMCAYLSQPEALMKSIASEKPLVGRPIDEVLAWRREAVPGGCFCHASSRAHKWGLALEAIHFALAQQQQLKPSNPDTAA